MADGTVTIETLLEDGNAKSGVNRLKQMFSSLDDSANKTGNVFKSVLGANLVGGAITKVAGIVSSGVRSMTGELNGSLKAWKTFEGNLEMLGMADSEIKKVQSNLQDYATKTIYSASDMASTYAQMAAIGYESSEKLVKGMGGIAAASENPAQAMKSMSQQMVQALSKPQLSWADFKIMLEQAPAGMAKVAEHMGMSLEELVTAIQDGEVSSKDFADAVAEVGTSADFQKMATEAKTVDQALDGLKETVANKMLPVFEKLSKFGVKAISKLTDAISKLDIEGFFKGINNAFRKIKFSRIGQGFASLFNKMEKPMEKFKTQLDQAFGWFKQGNFTQGFKKAGKAFSDVFSDLSVSIKKVDLEGRFSEAIRGLGDFLPFAKPIFNLMSDIANVRFDVLTGGLKAASQLLQGDFKGAWETVKTTATTAFNDITTALGNFTRDMGTNLKTGFSNLGKFLGDVGKDIQKFIFDSLGATSWGEVGSKVMGSIGDALKSGLSYIGDVGSSIFEWISGKLDGVNWRSTAKNVMQTLGDAFQGAVDFVGNVGSDVFDWISTSIEKVDWKNLGKDVGKFIGDSLQGIGDFLKGFKIDWSAIKTAFKKGEQAINDAAKALDDFAKGALDGLAEAFEIDDEIKAIEEALDSLSKIKFNGDFSELINSIKQAFKNAFSGYTWNDWLPEIGWGHGNGTKSVWDWQQGKIVTIPMDANLRLKNVNIEAGEVEKAKQMLKDRFSGQTAEVQSQVKMLTELMFDEEGKIRTEFQGLLNALGLKGDVTAETLVKAMLNEDGSLKQEVKDYIADKVNGTEVDTQVKTNANLGEVAISNPNALEEAIKSKLGNKVPNVDVAVEALMEYILNDDGSLSQEVKDYLASQGVQSGDVTAETLIDYLLRDSKTLSDLIRNHVQGQGTQDVGTVPASGDVELKPTSGKIEPFASPLNAGNVPATADEVRLQGGIPVMSDSGEVTYEQLTGKTNGEVEVFDTKAYSSNANVEMRDAKGQGDVDISQMGTIGGIQVKEGALTPLEVSVRKQMESVKTTINGYQEGIGATLGTTIKNAVQNATEGLGTSFTTPIRTAMESVKTTINGFQDGIGATLGTTVKNAVQNATEGLGTSFTTPIRTAMESVKTTITTFGPGISASFTTMWMAVSATTTASLAPLNANVMNAMNQMKINVLTSLTSIKSTFQSSFTSINTTVITSVNSMKSTISNSMNSVKSTMSSVMNSIKSTLTSSFNQMNSSVTSSMNSMKSNLTSAFNSMKSTVTSSMNSMVSSMRSIGMSGVGVMQSVGAQIGNGLASGLYSALGAVTAAANALVAQALRAARAKAMIHSPSRLFERELGAYLPQGAAKGIEKNLDYTNSAVQRMVDSMMQYKMSPEDLIGVGGRTLNGRMTIEGNNGAVNKSNSVVNNNQFGLTYNSSGSERDFSPEFMRKLIKEFAYYVQLEGGEMS